MNTKMLISAHVDGEVEDPWRERLDEAVRGNAEWSAEAELHRHVKAALAAAPEVEPASSQAAVWSRLQASLPTSGAPARPLAFSARRAWWAYPAAAAVLALVLGAGVWLGTRLPSAEVAELQVQVPAEYHLQLSGEGQLLTVSTLEGGSP